MKSIFLIIHTRPADDVRVVKFCKSFIKQGIKPYLILRWDKDLENTYSNSIAEVLPIGKDIPALLSNPLNFNPIWKNQLEKYIKDIKPDLIISREIILGTLIGTIAKKYRIPVIMDMAEHYPEAMRGSKKYNQNFLLRYIVRTLKYPDKIEHDSLKLMDGVITVCQEQNDRLRKDYNFNPNNISIVHNTPELDWFDNIRLGTAIPPKIFTYNGFMTKYRNLDTLLRAFAIASKKNSEIKLIMAGNGESYSDLVQLTKDLKIDKRVIFTGYYNQSQIKDIYSEMDIGILPFKTDIFINHTIANKFFDYMAVGKPMIVSQAKPMVRVLEETKAGIAVDCTSPEIIADTILNIQNYNLTEMSNNGLKYSLEKYNWSVDENNLINFILKYL